MSAYLAALRRSAGIDGPPVVPAATPDAAFDGDPFAAAESDTAGGLEVQPAAWSPPSAASPAGATAPQPAVPLAARRTDGMARPPTTVTPARPGHFEAAVQASTAPTPPDGPSPPAGGAAGGRPPTPLAPRQAASSPLHATVQAALRWVAADPVAAAAQSESGSGREFETRTGAITPARSTVAVEVGTDTPATPTTPDPPTPSAAAPARQPVQREIPAPPTPRPITVPAAAPQALELRIGQIHLHLDAPPVAAAPPHTPTSLRPPPPRDFSGSAASPAHSSLARARLRRL